MEFKDYYKIMGVARDATQDEKKRSCRKQARKYHPDVSKEADAETHFKELGEAYEVLKGDCLVILTIAAAACRYRSGEGLVPKNGTRPEFQSTHQTGSAKIAVWEMNVENSVPQFAICILEEQAQLTLADLRRACVVHAEKIIELVDIGVLEPQGREPARWIFVGDSLHRARKALRLQRELDIDLAGAALALELLDEIASLRTRLPAMGSQRTFDVKQGQK